MSIPEIRPSPSTPKLEIKPPAQRPIGNLMKSRLERHVKRLCIKNLRDKRVKCCAECPFQDLIEKAFPETAVLFKEKQRVTK